MTNVNEDLKVDGLTGVEVDTFRNVNKNKREWVSAIILNGDKLPLLFTGSSAENARDKAVDFYKQNLLNTVHNYDFIKIEGDDHEAQLKMLEGFNNEEKLPHVVYMKKDPSVDGRRIKGKVWVHKLDTMHRIKVVKEDEAKYLAKGYSEGRGPKWDEHGIPVPIKGKRVCVTDADDYVHPLKGKIWVNNGVERFRVHKDDKALWLEKGYVEGRGKLTDAAISIPEVETGAVTREFSTSDEEWTKVTDKEAIKEETEISAETAENNV